MALLAASCRSGGGSAQAAGYFCQINGLGGSVIGPGGLPGLARLRAMIREGLTDSSTSPKGQTINGWIDSCTQSNLSLNKLRFYAETLETPQKFKHADHIHAASRKSNRNNNGQ